MLWRLLADRLVPDKALRLRKPLSVWDVDQLARRVIMPTILDDLYRPSSYPIYRKLRERADAPRLGRPR